MTTIHLKIVHHTDADLKALIAKLDEELYERYPADEVFVVDFTDPKIEKMVFVVAYSDGNHPVGCGAIRPLDAETVELKRFYVDVSHRKLGIAKRMLDFLEEQTQVLHYRKIRLEAGTEQPEAISFYEKHGFYAIDKFGEYVDCASSLCYEKIL